METTALHTLRVAEGDGVSSERCLQCGTALAGPFCHTCGQHASVADRLTFRSLWHDFRVRRLSLDRGLPRTVRDLVLDPGRVARAFVEGRRQTYTHPITLLFLAYAAYAVVYGLFEDDLHRMMREQMVAALPADGPVDPVAEQATVAMEATMGVLFSYGAYFTVLIILPFAASLRWLLGDRGRSMAECAVFGTYLEVGVVIPSMVAFLPLSVWLDSPMLSSGGLLMYFVYAAVGARSFFDPRPGTMALSVLSVVIGLVVYLGLFMVVAGGYGFYVGMTSAP